MATRQARYLLGAREKKKYVVLSLAQYKRLLEDLHDLAVVAERRNEIPVSLAQMRRSRKHHRSHSIRLKRLI